MKNLFASPARLSRAIERLLWASMLLISCWAATGCSDSGRFWHAENTATQQKLIMTYPQLEIYPDSSLGFDLDAFSSVRWQPAKKDIPPVFDYTSTRHDEVRTLAKKLDFKNVSYTIQIAEDQYGMKLWKLRWRDSYLPSFEPHSALAIVDLLERK